MLRKVAGILTVAAICAASVAVAHPVHYAMAAADAKPALQPLPEKVYTALAGDRDAARARALADCRKATNRDCVVIASGALAHPDTH
jgi:hypothetical protein